MILAMRKRENKMVKGPSSKKANLMAIGIVPPMMEAKIRAGRARRWVDIERL